MADNEFLYKLNVESNLKRVNADLATFVKIGAGLTAFVGSAKLVANAFNNIDTLSAALGQDATYLREVGQQFRLIGLSAEQGTGLVANLSKQIRDFQQFGEGKFEELGRLNIDISQIKTAQQFINQLRRSAGEDIDVFRATAGRLGLDAGQMKYLLQSRADFTKNQQLASEQVKGTQQSIADAKKLNEDVARLSASFEMLGQSVLRLTTYLTPLINKISTVLNELPENIETIGNFVGDKASDVRNWFGTLQSRNDELSNKIKARKEAKKSGTYINEASFLRDYEARKMSEIVNNISKSKVAEFTPQNINWTINGQPRASNQSSSVDNTKNINNNITVNVGSADDGDKIIKILNQYNGG